MTKLLISLPLSNEAQKYYGSGSPTFNKAFDAGVDLPFVKDVKPFDSELTETLDLISFETVFAMYTFQTSDLSVDFEDDGYRSVSYKLQSFLCNPNNFAFPTHFDIRPRSSISKTRFRLANCVGTIDESYKGLVTNFPNQSNRKIGYPDILEADTLGCYLDYHPRLGKSPSNKPYISAGERLLQIVAPNLDKIVWVRLDFTEKNCIFWSNVIANVSRKGFGSTGS